MKRAVERKEHEQGGSDGGEGLERRSGSGGEVSFTSFSSMFKE